MNDQSIVASLLARLASLTLAAILVTSGVAEAQLATPNAGLPSFGLGVPGASSSLGGVGIPLGATEMSTSGLSPSPSPGLSVTTPGLVGSPANGIGVPTVGGLSPMLPWYGYSPPSANGMGPTNYGTGGMQSLPGTPVR